MFALIKLPFKLLSLPLMAVFSIMAFLVKILSNLSGYVLSPLILFVLGCGVYSVVCQQWNHVFLLGIIGLVLFHSEKFCSVLKGFYHLATLLSCRVAYFYIGG